MIQFHFLINITYHFLQLYFKDHCKGYFWYLQYAGQLYVYTYIRNISHSFACERRVFITKAPAPVPWVTRQIFPPSSRGAAAGPVPSREGCRRSTGMAALVGRHQGFLSWRPSPCGALSPPGRVQGRLAPPGRRGPVPLSLSSRLAEEGPPPPSHGPVQTHPPAAATWRERPRYASAPVCLPPSLRSRGSEQEQADLQAWQPGPSWAFLSMSSARSRHRALSRYTQVLSRVSFFPFIF